MSILEHIRCHDDLIALSDAERLALCDEIRQFLVSHVSQTGGHLASNLGVVELTVAVETVFNTEKDRLVFDVGHQSYVHKLLTGRQADFADLRQFGGMAGFPKPSESVTDAFVAGHASSSVSIALGMARARTLMHQDYQVVSLMGDGAATGGMVYEGLNDAAESREPMVIILNDNEMSIGRNVGGMAKHLSRLRTKSGYLGAKRRYRAILQKIPGGKAVYRVTRKVKDWMRRTLIPSTIFENMGLAYFGPMDGHDLSELISVLENAKQLGRPVVVHVITQKGKGYAPAENNPSGYHGVGSFDPEVGIAAGKGKVTFSDAFGQTLCQLAKEDERLCAITAAMPAGTGLSEFGKQFPERLFDVGIAEEHAVSMAGGLAKQGMVPVVALYSTFLQRSFDMLMQDVGLLGLHVVLGVDRAGLVGEDGETHHGAFDVGFLRQVPGMKILCPATTEELRVMLRWAVQACNCPIAVRYPRGGDRVTLPAAWPNEVACYGEGEELAIVTYGTMVDNALKASALLQQQGVVSRVVRLLSVSPLPVQQLKAALGAVHKVIVVEETGSASGIGRVLAFELSGMDVTCMDLGDKFVTHGEIARLYEHCGLHPEGIVNTALEVMHREG